ncbi:MAG: hypothetical protein RMK94_17395, partial [Armatimonadota bacterium]|nr:hypothetical protein [Armatimonadota bacterium]
FGDERWTKIPPFADKPVARWLGDFRLDLAQTIQRQRRMGILGLTKLDVGADEIRPNRYSGGNFFGQTVVCPYFTTKAFSIERNSHSVGHRQNCLDGQIIQNHD